MKRSPRVLARRARLIGLPVAGIAALAVLPTNGFSATPTPRHIPGAGNSNPLTTSAPDLSSVAISDLSSGSVLYCFDSVVAAPSSANDYYLITYDSNRYMRPSSVKVSAGNANCVLATFTGGLDIAQATIGAVATGAAKDSAGRPSIQASEPVSQGSAASPSAGGTNGPDLTGVTTNLDQNYIDFNFDETIDPALSSGASADSGSQLDPTKFHFIADQGSVVNGTSAARQGSSSVRVKFGAAVDKATRVFVDPQAVRDVPQSGTFPGTPASLANNGAANTTPNGTDAASVQGKSSGLPELASVSGGPQEVTLTYSKDVNKGAAASIIAVADDGRVFTAQSITEAGNNALRVTFDASIGTDASSIVRVVDKGGAATSRGDTTPLPSAPSRVNTNTANNAPGYTDAPDLVQVATDGANNQQIFRFDENVANATSAGFFAVTSDGNAAAASGTPVLGGGLVKVNIPSSASAAVGGASGQNAAVDALGHESPLSGVANTTQAGAPAPAPAPTPTPTPTPAQKKTHFKTTASVKRRTKSKYKYAGKITSKGRGCKVGRKVVLRVSGRGTHSYGSTSTRSDGTYTIKRRKRLSGKKVYVAVAERNGKKYPLDFCSAGKSKTIKG